jgi:hypothetical protein
MFFSYYVSFECSTHFCSRLAHWWLPCREVFVLLHCWSERRQCRSFDQTYHPWWPGTTRSCIDTKRTMFCCTYQQLAEELLKRLHKMIWLSAVLKILKCFLFHYHQLSPIFLNSNSLTSDKTNLNVEAIWLTDQSQGPWGNLKAEPALICVHGQEVQRPRAEPSKIIDRGDEKVRDRRSFWELRPTLGAFCDRLLKDV